MRVIVNELQMLKQKTGIGHYTAELLRALRSQIGDDEQVDGFPTGWLRPLTRRCFRAGQPVPSNSSISPGTLSRMRGQATQWLRDTFQGFLERRFHAACSGSRYHLYHEPNFLPLPADCPTIATWHDLSVLLHPEWHPAERVRRFDRQLPEAIARCAHFLTDAESVRQEMIHGLGIRPERVTRVHLGIRPEFRPLPAEQVRRGLARLSLPPQYLLFVGTIEPRKNVQFLLETYCALPASVRSRWPLLLVGGWGWNAAGVAEHLQDVARHQGVIHLGYVPDPDLAIIYNGARALLCPSFYEGFGLPPLEMMACGGAVIGSTAAVLQETIGRQAHLIHAENSDGWLMAMMRIVADQDWWQKLRNGATAVARPFTWERCAAETLRVYRVVCEQGVVPSESSRRAAG